MRKNKKNIIYSILLLILLFIGIGYAYLTSNLSITGSTEIAANSWDIHFANLNVTEGSVDATIPATIDPTDTTSISYTVKLNRPKDFYEFTVDVVNEGTLPGKISISSLSGITSEAEDIVLYTVNYTNGNPVQIGDILNGGSSKSIKVRVFYNDEIEADDLPSTNLNLTLTYTLQYVQSEEEEFTTNDMVQQLKTENSSCFTKYTGQVTDQVGQTVTASNVYFNKCANKRNIIFANMCWQMIRTTETDGIKMIYNGDVVDGKCLNTRGNHKGIVQYSPVTQTLSSSYLYGSTFTYNLETGEFTLLNTETATWSDSTYEILIGKFTCKTSNDICTTLFEINAYESNTSAYASNYLIDNTNYAQIGRSSYNANSESPAMVGYMFNKVYNYKYKSPGSIVYKYGSGFIYNNGTYTLSGTTQNISDWSNGYNTIDNTHYTCWNTSGTCNTISYIYYTDSSDAYYFDISDGKSVNDILDEMLYSNDVNRYNSSIKGIIDNWYAQNLSSKTNILEDTVYCNARNITDYGGWNSDGGSTTSYPSLQFKNYNTTINLACPNATDQFAVGNISARLTYPVGLINNEEWYNIGANSLKKTGVEYWSLSPYYFNNYNASVRIIDTDGSLYIDFYVDNFFGMRPAVSLKNGTRITEGDGSEESPFIIE